MAIENAKTLNVRIKNKYDSYENWVASGLVLEAGEIAIAYTTVNVTVDNGTAKHPALLMKVGNGTDTFANLPWMSAKAADVLSVCKNEADLKEFINSVITDAGVATDAALSQLSGQVTTNKNDIKTLQDDLNTPETGLKARVTTAEGAIDALELLVGDTAVDAQIDAKIAALNLANTYEAKGAAAAAQTAAEGHADSLDAAMNTRVEALEAIDHDHDNKGVLDGITAEKVAAWDAAEQNAKDHANGLNTAMDGRVAALEAKFTGEDSVADQIAAAVAAEAKLRDDADKALQEQIEGNDADILALQQLVGDKKVETAIADAVAAEAEIARAAEKANADAIKTISDDYLKAADKTELEGKITANEDAIKLLTNGVSAEEVDGVNDLIQYVKDHGTEVTGIKADIKANADAIGKATEGDTVGTGLYKRIEDAEAAISAVEEDLNTEKTGLKARMADAETAIDALEVLVGDTSVDAQIDAKLKVDGVEKYALATDLAKTDGEVAKKANDADLKAVAKSGLINDLSIAEGTVLVFDCGSSAV